MVAKNQQLLQDVHVSIAIVVKKSTSITKHICGYCNGYKKTNHYYDTYMHILHIRNDLMEIIIKRM
jgi:hypothetical protein